MPLYDHFVVTGAWWDHVDAVAIALLGPILRQDRSAVEPIVRTWIHDPDRWRRRTSIIVQNGAKSETDTALLADAILASVDDRDFFLRKGIGWALREYAKTDPDWVRAFVDAHEARLSPLSRREAREAPRVTVRPRVAPNRPKCDDHVSTGRTARGYRRASSRRQPAEGGAPTTRSAAPSMGDTTEHIDPERQPRS